MRPASAAPDGAAEQIEIWTADRRVLRGEVHEPPRGTPLVAVAVLAHAMFGRRTAFARPPRAGLARFVAARGVRAVTFDFRGHGESGPTVAEGGSWSYDDLVRRDLPAVVACARARSRGLPVVVVGHSLGGHAALAAQGTERLEADGVLALASSMWLPAWEPDLARRAQKRAVVAVARLVLERTGYFPARALRQGSDDEAYPYMDAVLRVAERGAFRSDDFRDDYRAAFARVRVPVVGLASDGDALQANPATMARMLAEVSGPRELVRVRASDDGGPAPGHAALVTTPRASRAWGEALAALLRLVRARRR